MNREAYELANRIETVPDRDGDCREERLSDTEIGRYKKRILQEIKKEKKPQKKRLRGVYAAACAALVLLAGTVVFGDEVHAMIRQIGWSIGNALGVSADLADYSEVVNTSISDGKYIVTLQEVMVTEEKLIVSYTIEREDGNSLKELEDPSGGVNLGKSIDPETDLYINGEKVQCAIIVDCRFINEEKTVVGAAAQFQLLPAEIDLSRENEYEIGFSRVRWNRAFHMGEFVFKTDGTDLMAATKRTVIGKTFELPDGVKVTLDEFAANELEQKISYSLSAHTDYILEVKAVDSSGNRAEFGTRVQGSEAGYMQNEKMIEDGSEYNSRLDDSAESASMTLYAAELPKQGGEVKGDYTQIGESFAIEF